MSARRPPWSALLLLPLALAAGSARAHCGSAYCLVNTSWSTQGLWSAPGSRLDLRDEYIDQNTLRRGRGAGDEEDAAAPTSPARRVAGETTGAAPSPHHEAAPHTPLRTLNRVTSLSFEHSVDRRFGIAVIVPWVSRLHDALYVGAHGTHVHTATFSRLGDARVLGRWQVTESDGVHLGLDAGAKLPTGATDAPGPHGSTLERNLQAGTGTTDAILGVYANGRLGATGAWFAQATAQSALAPHGGYAPGNTLQLDAGLSQAFGTRTLGLLQLNARTSGRDRGVEAAPEDSGARSLSLSPGLDVNLAPTLQLYAFVEKPLWRRVNGEQLVAGWAAAAGVNWMF